MIPQMLSIDSGKSEQICNFIDFCSYGFYRGIFAPIAPNESLPLFTGFPVYLMYPRGIDFQKSTVSTGDFIDFFPLCGFDERCIKHTGNKFIVTKEIIDFQQKWVNTQNPLKCIDFSRIIEICCFAWLLVKTLKSVDFCENHENP